MSYFSKECCSRPVSGGFTYDMVESPISPFSGAIVDIDVVPPSASMDVAAHEAGHALAHHLFGRRLSEVRVTEPAQCQSLSEPRPLSRQQSIAIKLAGMVAEDRLEGVVIHSTGFHLRRYFDKIRALHLGPCDTCQAVLCAIGGVGADAGNGAAFRFYRRAENLAIEMMADGYAWAGVQALAYRLMTNGIVDGETAHSVLSQHVEFGAYADKETHV
ncbi:hypothetical protein [Devosia naphthalenivorans]|uniref:hypothetical protein n=1 Tax=Devosia naphthalenivorans TaxID=2082392 RepID=UPI000D3C93E7|nr:hypothetical protein [Devosia naphthalenivorans]